MDTVAQDTSKTATGVSSMDAKDAEEDQAAVTASGARRPLGRSRHDGASEALSVQPVPEQPRLHLAEEKPRLPLAEEQPVALYANGTKIAVFMCTPRDLVELGWGHLAGRGIVSAFPVGEGGRCLPRPDIRVCDSRARIDVRAAGLTMDGGMDLGQVIASGCGAGAIFSPAFLFKPAIALDWRTSLARLSALCARMFASAELHKLTGGMHIAAMERLSGAEPWFTAREDVGRHNAVDKVIGSTLLAGVTPGDCALLSSGRIAADMAIKAVATGIPIVGSRSIPTTTAYEIALRAGITLVGRIGSRQPVVYTHPERIGE